MSSSTSGAHNPSWEQRIQGYRGDISQRNAQLLKQVKDEGSFRDEFEKLCKSADVIQYHRLLGQFEFYSINDFTSALEKADRRSSPLSLVALIYSGTLVALQTASDANVKPGRVVEMIGTLNSSVPNIGKMVTHCASFDGILKPLRTIFIAYMEVLLLTISTFRPPHSVTPDDTFASICDAVENAKRTFQQQDNAFHRLYGRFLDTTSTRTEDGSSQYTYGSVGSRASEHEVKGEYTEIEALGQGSGGVVHKVKQKATNWELARKKILVTGDTKDELTKRDRQVNDEISIMKELVHIHIAQIRSVDKVPAPSGCAYLLYITPAAQYNLEEFLRECYGNGCLEKDVKMILPWFSCLVEALRCVHRHGVVHRDIKPRNILVNDSRVYLADFGISKNLSNHTFGSTHGGAPVGTFPYIAPEVFTGSTKDPPADIFSLGCVFSEMLTVCARRSLSDFEEARCRGFPKGAFRDNIREVKQWIGGLACDDSVLNTAEPLIKRMLVSEPAKRCSADSLRTWMMSNADEQFECHIH